MHTRTNSFWKARDRPTVWGSYKPGDWAGARHRRAIHQPRRWRFLAAVVLALVVAQAPFSPAQAQEPEVSATLAAVPEQLYIGQPFQLILTIRARGVTLGKEFGLDGLIVGQLIGLGTFQELAPTREGDGAQAVETRHFRCDGQALNPGAVQLAPTLRFNQLTHERTFFGTTTFQSPRSIPVTPVTISISTMPTEGRPADFSGAIGQFMFTVDASPRDVAVGDLVTLTISVNGAGRFEGIACPTLTPDPRFKVYPPRQVATSQPGSLSFEQVVIPQDTNATATPEARFSFFDTSTATYRTLTAGHIPLRYHARDAVPAFTPYRPDATPVGLSGGTQAVEARTGTAAPASASAAGWRAFTQSVSWPVLSAVGAAVSFIMAGLAVGATIWRHRRGISARTPRRGAMASVLVGVICLVASRHFRQVLANGQMERVVAHATAARVAPSLQARTLIEFPQDTRVTITETWPGWFCVAHGSSRGWIPEEALEAR